SHRGDSVRSSRRRMACPLFLHRPRVRIPHSQSPRSARAGGRARVARAAPAPCRCHAPRGPGVGGTARFHHFPLGPVPGEGSGQDARPARRAAGRRTCDNLRRGAQFPPSSGALDGGVSVARRPRQVARARYGRSAGSQGPRGTWAQCPARRAVLRTSDLSRRAGELTMATTRQITSTLREDGKLVVELAETELPEPAGSQVLIRVEAAPINPSDLGLLFGPADLSQASFEEGRITCPMPEPAMRAMAARVGQTMPVGNEGAGTVVAAGDSPEAQALIGKRVACVPGGMYAEHVIADARMCMPLPADLPIELGAASFVNPLTALGFVETMRAEGFSALV